jgi:hypothetical protein
MDRRFIAILTLGPVAFVGLVAAVTAALVGTSPQEARKAVPNAPLLVASPTDPAIPPTPDPALGSVRTEEPTVSPGTTASIDPVARPAPGRNRAGATIPVRPPDAEPEVLGGISPAVKPATPPLKEGAAAPVARPARQAAAAPPPQRALPERRPDGVLSAVEVRRLKAALRLTADQERYWPPVEAVLIEIGAQQMAMVQAGRPPGDALGFGMKMRAYSAARPLLGLLQEDQKAEIRRRARALGFEAVAAAI